MRHLASRLLAPSAILVAASLVSPAPPLRAADTTILAGHWTIDKGQSEFPDEIGFDMQVETAAQSTASTNSGRSRVPRVGTAAPALTIAHEGEQTLKILGDVTDEAEHPWPVLTIDEAEGVVTITDGGSQVRRFHPGKDDEQRLADGGITTHTKWDKNALVIDYTVEKDRDVRYTYSRSPDAAPLAVDVSFRDHGHGDTVRRVYVAAK